MNINAAILWEQGAPLSVEGAELEVPRAGEVLVEVKAAGVCHSDLQPALTVSTVSTMLWMRWRAVKARAELFAGKGARVGISPTLFIKHSRLQLTSITSSLRPGRSAFSTAGIVFLHARLESKEY